MTEQEINVAGRFWAKVDKGANDTLCCWNWTGAKGGNGHGQFWLNGRLTPAHHFQLRDKIKIGQVVCHHCDNPLCVRPTHLFIGSQSDNMKDCVAKGRHRHGVSYGQAHHNSKLTNEQVERARNCPRKYGEAIKLAREFGVSNTVICEIRDGKRWRGNND